MDKDPYAVLGLSRDATDEQIKKAYRELSKKYHPDLNPGNEQAARRMNEINSAYSQIKSAAKNDQRAYQSQYDWGDYYTQGSRYSYSQERSEYTAAKNYMRNGMYKEALTALSGIPMTERDAKWFYLSAGANMYLGNKVIAQEHASRACEIEPDNEEYRRLLVQIRSGGYFYDAYSQSYGRSINFNPICTGLCLSYMCFGGSCGCPPILCF